MATKRSHPVTGMAAVIQRPGERADIRRCLVQCYLVGTDTSPAALALEIGVHAQIMYRWLQEDETSLSRASTDLVDTWLQTRGLWHPAKPSGKGRDLLSRYGAV